PAGALDGQLLEPPVGVDALDGRNLGPGAVGLELPRQSVVGQVHVEDLLEAGSQLVVGDGRQGLHAPIEVAGHQVGRAEVVGALSVRTEPVDAGVLWVEDVGRGYEDVMRMPRCAYALTE